MLRLLFLMSVLTILSLSTSAQTSEKVKAFEVADGTQSSDISVVFQLIFEGVVPNLTAKDFELITTEQIQTASISSINPLNNGYEVLVDGIPANSDGFLKLIYFPEGKEKSDLSLAYNQNEIAAYHFIGAAFDISRVSNLSNPNRSFLLDFEGNSRSLRFDESGMNMYVIDIRLDRIIQYKLSSPFDIASAQFYTDLSIAELDSNPILFRFSNGGYRLHFYGNWTKTFFQFDLKEPYDLTTLLEGYKKMSIELPRNPEIIWPRDFSFSIDGKRMFITAPSDANVYEYETTQPFDISALRFRKKYEVLNDGSNVWTNRELRFRPDGRKAYYSHNFPKLYEFNVTIPFDITTAKYQSDYENLQLGNTNIQYNINSQNFNADGTSLIILYNGRGLNRVDEYFLDAKELSISRIELYLKRNEGKSDSLISTNSSSIRPRLSYAQNNLVIKSSNTSDNPKDSILYKYRFGERDWSNWTTSNELVFENLTSDKYDFQIRAKNRYGQISAPVKIAFKILPPWYISQTAIGAYIFLIIIIPIGIIRVNQRKLRKRNRVLERTVDERTQEIRERISELEEANGTIKAQAERLQKLDEVKSKFFANISHELRTPLTLINAPIAALLEKGSLKKEEVEETLKIAQNNGNNLLHLVEEILDLTKLEAGKLELSENPVNLYEYLNDLINPYRLRLESKSIDFQFDYQLSEEMSVLIDGSKAAKVINNLLSNATKFTPQNGKINFCVRNDVEAGTIEFVISDSGPGIHPKDLPHIFNRFYQAEFGGEKAQGGTGIGLALAKELAILFGGNLSVKSQFGHGSTFTFELPLKELDGKVVMAVTEPILEVLDNAIHDTVERYGRQFDVKLPVLLVTEDHPQMRSFIASHLSPYFEIRQADNGKVALDILKKEQIDIVISDVMMPVMDGFELLEAMKNDETLRSISVIMLTARAEKEDKLFALTLGIDDYLTKPFVPSVFLARIKNILDNRIKLVKQFQNTSSNEEERQKELKEFIELHGITEEEFEIFKLLAKRLTNNEIAEQLQISTNTVKYHLKKIFFKLDISTRQEGAKQAENLIG